MASLAASTVQRGLSARQGPVRGSRRHLVVQNAVKEVFMPALSSTMTGRPRAGAQAGRPPALTCAPLPTAFVGAQMTMWAIPGPLAKAA